MKRMSVPLTVVLIFAILSGCSLSGGDTGPVVYVAGYHLDGTNVAAYWKDDGASISEIDLHTGSNSEATDIYIDAGGTVYISGYYLNGLVYVAVYWVDDGVSVTEHILHASSDAQATGIFVVADGTVYVSGHYDDSGTDVASYWIDDGTAVTPRVLHDAGDSAATDIHVDAGGVVYVSGYYYDGTHDVAVYWMDPGTVPVRTDLYTTGLSQANALALYGSDVHVAGRYLDSSVWAAVWKNDASGLRSLDSRSANAKAIIIVDGEPLAAGDFLGTGNIRRAATWRIGGTVSLTTLGGTGDDPAFANGLAVLDGDVYVAGYRVQGFDQAVYWRNGTLIPLSPDTESRGNAICVQ